MVVELVLVLVMLQGPIFIPDLPKIPFTGEKVAQLEAPWCRPGSGVSASGAAMQARGAVMWATGAVMWATTGPRVMRTTGAAM